MVLAHPVVVPTKLAVRHGYWCLRGLTLGNPTLPLKVHSILFVCKGNICRSPFAARRAERLLETAGLCTLRCTSAGLRASVATRSPDDARAAALEHGVSLDSHRPRQLTRELIKSADLIVVMEVGQLRILRRRYPESANRIFLLALMEDPVATGYERYNIPDPFGHPRAVFDACFQRVDHALHRLINDLAGAGRLVAIGSEEARKV